MSRCGLVAWYSANGVSTSFHIPSGIAPSIGPGTLLLRDRHHEEIGPSWCLGAAKMVTSKPMEAMVSQLFGTRN